MLLINSFRWKFSFLLLAFLPFSISCSNKSLVATEVLTEVANVPALQFESTVPVFTVGGLDQPEAVRYDPEQDVYFIATFNGEVAEDANGYIAKVSAADGSIIEQRFMVGSAKWPFHAGRGMYLDGDSLWVADAEGIHRFNRYSGEQQEFIDFSEFNPGFLNDIVKANDDALYVTDTRTSQLFKVSNGVVMVVAETPYPANGIAIDPASGLLALAPWGGSSEVTAWSIEDQSFHPVASLSVDHAIDGLEYVLGTLVTASQSDNSLHGYKDGVDQIVLELNGPPADIGVDTKRNRIAVPYVRLDKVEFFQIKSD